MNRKFFRNKNFSLPHGLCPKLFHQTVYHPVSLFPQRNASRRIIFLEFFHTLIFRGLDQHRELFLRSFRSSPFGSAKNQFGDSKNNSFQLNS